jgi:hypothetical protein
MPGIQAKKIVQPLKEVRAFPGQGRPDTPEVRSMQALEKSRRKRIKIDCMNTLEAGQEGTLKAPSSARPEQQQSFAPVIPGSQPPVDSCNKLAPSLPVA